ncbi:MAG: hypothetical protein O2812_04340 [Chloroflexi bacterium]|nr:hypothetical protein [Chloroflexota bacterium]
MGQYDPTAQYEVTNEHMGGMGGSSGGNTVLLNALRPADPRYTEFPLAEDPGVDASLSYVVALWPVLDLRPLPLRQAHGLRAAGHKHGELLPDGRTNEKRQPTGAC